MFAENAPAKPWLFAVGCAVSDEGAKALFASYGLAPVRYFFEMSTDPSKATPQPTPAGLTIAPYTDEWRKPLYDAYIEGFGDMWGFQHRTLERWQALSVDNDGFRPDLSRLALHGDEVVSFVCSYDSADNGMFIGQIATRRAWRRQGLASALIAESLLAAAAAGKQRAGLGVDADSLTGAVGVYERAGFRVIQRHVDYHGPVTPEHQSP
jgi:ribosomal protein S18 acetylase RimI-like enzyme